MANAAQPAGSAQPAAPAAPTPGESLSVLPASADLRSGETQAFEVRDQNGNPVRGLKWSLSADSPGQVGIDSGVYSAPGRLFKSRRVVVTATKGEGENAARANATIDLDPGRTWIPILGLGWIGLFVLILFVLLRYWSHLCPNCMAPGLHITPPIVTLTSGQAQQFVASADATWTNSVNAGGLYVAPSKVDAEQIVTVTATSTADTKQSATGVVKLSPAAGFSIFPGNVTVTQGETVELTASVMGSAQVTPEWLIPAAGKIEKKGNSAVYTAPDDPKPQVVVVMAEARIPPPPPTTSAPTPTQAPTLLAGALISVVPKEPKACDARAPGDELWGVILLVALVGALGGLTHAMGSFGTYVGNRELKTSWLWWYGLKPALSAMVAVLIFLVFRAGLGTPTLGLEAANCFTVAGFAGLVGLFAEPATVKLKDIFDVLFTPRRDPRDDKAGQTQTSTAAVPEIADVAPKPLTAGAAQVLRLTGKNFASGCRVKFDDTLLTPKSVTASTIEVEIPADKMTIGKHPVTVVNRPPSGDASKAFDVDVD